MTGRLKAALALLAGVVLLAAVACGGGTTGTGEAPLKVVATTAQIAALAREVAGDRADVRALIPPGVDPHQFEPTTSDLTALEEADLVLRHGMGLDDFLDDVLAGAGKGDAVTVTAGLPVEEGALAGDRSLDPHVWLDPDLARMMVDNIAQALSAADPARAEAYAAAAATYGDRLEEVDGQVRALIDSIPPAARKLVTNHDGFGYFARRYGLEVVGAVIPTISTEGAPSARETAALLDTIEREGVKAVFVESSASPGLARQLAEDAGVAVVEDLYVDSLGGPGSGAETVDGMLLANGRLIAEALR